MTTKPPLERLAEIARMFAKAKKRLKGIHQSDFFTRAQLERIEELARTEPQPKEK